MTENLRDRLYNHEVIPPAAVWEGIASELGNEQEHSKLREKVLATRIDPPEAVWTNISSLLNTPASAGRRLFKIGHLNRVAAIVAGVVLLGSVFLLVNKQPGKNPVAIGDITSESGSSLLKSTQSPPVVPPPRKPVLASVRSSVARGISLYSTIKSKKKISSGSKRYLYKSIVKEDEDLLLPSVTIPAKPIRNENGDIIQDSKLLSKLNDKYVSVTSPSGQQTKISSKFVNLLLYLNGDNDSDENEGIFHKTFLESLIWKSKFQSWRNSISQTAFIPSSTNFMGILEMRDLILQHGEVNQQ